MVARDFLRVVPLAFGDRPYTVSGNRVLLTVGASQLEILLTERPPRKLGPTVRVPVLQVEMTFSSYSEAERAAFMTRFDRYFLRAGG